MKTMQQGDRQLRVCIGCAEEWYSAAHCSPEPAYCESCGSPLLETLDTVMAAIRNPGSCSETDVRWLDDFPASEPGLRG